MEKSFLQQLAQFGVLSRDKIRGQLQEMQSLVRHGFVKKVLRKGRVFYEVTEKALPVLDQLRSQLLAEAKMRRLLYPRRKNFYDALLSDLRFFDDSKKEAQDFLFLSDWRLNQPPKKSQLKLAQNRYYEQKISR